MYVIFKSQWKDLKLKKESNIFQVHMENQEAHKNLRRNKKGVSVDKIEPLPVNYKRPAGFTLIPTLLGTNRDPLDASNRKSSYYESIQDEVLR